MIIVMMLMNMVMKMSNVWSARPGHSLPAGPCESLACGPSVRPLRLTNYAPKSQTNLPANFYPSNNNLIQALLVLLITNMISANNDDNDKHPLLMMIMMMLKKMLIMPVAMNDQRQQQRRSQTNLSAGPCLQQSAFYYALNGTVVAP